MVIVNKHEKMVKCITVIHEQLQQVATNHTAPDSASTRPALLLCAFPSPSLLDSAINGPLAFEAACLGECRLNLRKLKPQNSVVYALHCTPSTGSPTVETSTFHPN
jgi:hypothetical protein